MSSHISDERNELKEDDEKLQAALHEFVDPWDDDEYSDDDDEDDDQLLIDLDNETSEQTATSSLIGSASRSQSNIVADEESQDVVSRPDIQLPDQGEVVEESADPRETLYLNRALQDILNNHIESIIEALEINKEKQTKIEEDVTEQPLKTMGRGSNAGPFRAPFFRLGNSFPQPNEDVIQKKLSADYDVVKVELMKDVRHPKKGTKIMLREAVLEDHLERILKPAVTQMELEIKKRDAVIEEYDSLEFNLQTERSRLKKFLSEPKTDEVLLMIKEVKKTIKVLEENVEEKRKVIDEHKEAIIKLENEIEQKRNSSEESLLLEVETDKVDWMKIAKLNFGNHNTWLDCQKTWENQVSPAVNRAAWTKEEDHKLRQLVANSETCDWREIAAEIGHKRTPFQCCSRYQQRFNPDLKPRTWTPQEDAKLLKVTANIKDSVGFFSWTKVSSLMESRSPLECMSRFTKIDPSQARGRWTALEDAKLLAAVEMIGPCWSKVSKFLGTRNMLQCRDRYTNSLAPNINFSHFTYDEDIKLLRLYQTQGSVWSKISPEFIGRTDSMIMNRYRQLMKWKQKAEWFQRQSEATKRMLLGKSLTVNERQRFMDKSKDYYRLQLGILPEDYKRQELDRQNGVDPDIIPPRPPLYLRCYAVDGSVRQTGQYNRWSRKLEFHKQLRENLQKLMEKEFEASAKGRKRKKRLAELSEKETHVIMNETAMATVSGRPKATCRNRKPYVKSQMIKLEAALNKAFLHAGTTSVQELIKSSLMDKKKPGPIEKYIRIESELKSILRRKGRTLSKLGRARRFFERDTRPIQVIEDELDELDSTVPVMLMKVFGADIQYMHNSAQLRCLQFQEELSNLPSYEEDEDFKQEEADTQEAIQKLLDRTDITDAYRQQQMSVLKGKLKALRKIYREKNYLNSKIIENKINTFQDDLDYLASLNVEKQEGEVNKNLALMACSPRGSLGTEFDSEMEVLCVSFSLDNKSTSDTQSPASPVLQIQSSAENQSEQEKDQASNDGENKAFAVPAVPAKRKRRLSKLKDKPLKKIFKPLSKEEIARARRGIATLGKKIYTKLPFLPPCLSSLLSLRALLLMKKKLMDKAGSLYEPERYKRGPRVEIDLAEDGDAAVSIREQSQAEGSGAWFLNTHTQQLADQAKRFKGYVSRRVTAPRKLQTLDYSEEHNSMFMERMKYGRRQRPNPDARTFQSDLVQVFPLEERGGAVSSKRRSFSTSEDEMKPIILETGSKNSDDASCYEVVMHFAGNFTEVQSPVKKASKTQESTQSDPHTSNGTPEINKIDETHSGLETITCKTSASVIKKDEVASGGCITNGNQGGNIFPSKSESTAVQAIKTLASDAHSVIDMRETKHIPGFEEDDDVVAVIHLDDDDDDDLNHTQSIIKLSESHNNISTHTAADSEIDEAEMFTVSVQPQIVDSQSDLRRMELPDNDVHRILRNCRVRGKKSNVILVGVDETSKSIVHFKANDDRFTAFEARPTNAAESTLGRRPRVYSYVDERKKAIPDYLSILRRTNEYKLLRARFHALFMWPVLISTTEPSPLNDGSLPTRLNSYSAWLRQNFGKTKKRKRARTKRSVAQRKHLENMLMCSREARKKKAMKDSSTKLEVTVAEDDESNGPVRQGAGPAVEQEDAIAAQDMEADGQAEQPSAVNEDNDQMNGVAVKEHKVRKRNNRKRVHVRNTKYDEILRKRSRQAEQVPSEEPQAEESSAKLLPQWWRDAVLAAMIAKKAMTDDGETDEVNIEEDDDFLDKGNYSDDEWYQEMRKEEEQKKEKKERRGRKKTKVIDSQEEEPTSEYTLHVEEPTSEYTLEIDVAE